jgi:general L-amino acid transport system substrate-binding protein
MAAKSSARRPLDRSARRRFSPASSSVNVIEASKVNFRMDQWRRLERLGRATLRWAAATYVLATTGFACSAGSSPTLTAVKARGSLVCGVNEGLPGFSYVDERGIWTGFDVDFCRAIAAAIFGDPKKVKLVPLSADARFQALRDGKIDVLSRNSTWTMGRETEFGLTFVGVTYYDGQGFMVPRALRINSALELDGAKVCVQSGTTTIDNLADFFTSNGMTLQEVISGSADESIKNYDAGLCSVLTSDLSQLYAVRLRLAKPRDQVILPDVISKEPLGPVVRDNDLQWIGVVKWVYFAMINAEELGVSSRTIDQALKSQKPEVKRLVGTSGDFGEEIGLTNAWAANIIRYVGNYGEVFERNLGAKTPLAIPRGLNQLWNDGGVQYAPPIR